MLGRYRGDRDRRPLPDRASLTSSEAEERFALLEVERYDVAVDLRGLFEGELLEATSTATFRCHRPGASTFVDCTGEITHATLNGVDLDPATRRARPAAAARPAGRQRPRGQLPPDRHRQRPRHPAHGRHQRQARLPLDHLRARHGPPRLRQLRPARPQGRARASRSAPPTPGRSPATPAHTSVDDLPDGGRVWRFADTPRLSTYVTVFNAGPFYEIRETRGGYDLGLYCRQSLKHLLDRDAEELFELTEQGLAWFGEKFGAPFPQEKYDQVFVPDMGGAMENWGCVTFGDGLLFRSTPTHSQRLTLTSILLHEMAHMWFGDLVTMKWWNDLWLNEAFASWASTWAAVGATKYRDGWATFLAGGKLEGYRVDMGPASHPIRGDVPDVSQAMANFDAISYQKGQSVLKQLSAYVGEEAFLTGLQAYFREHAWGNTRLEDLTGAVGAASGEDLSGWESAWLDSSGTDTLSLEGGTLLASRAPRRRAAAAPPRHRLLRRRRRRRAPSRRRRRGPHRRRARPR